MNRFVSVPVVAGMILLAALPRANAAAPTFQDLMDPAVFPEPQRGMLVEQAGIADNALQIRTTGAELRLDASGNGVFRQRIGRDRETARIRITGLTATPEVTHSSPGLAFARFASPKLDLRANGDSLFMFHAHEPVTFEITRAIDVGFSAVYRGNGVLFDEWGGFGLFCSERDFEGALRPYEECVARYTLPADGVLWIGICPPKPYDWERSLHDNVVWHWSRTSAYPPDPELAAWSREGNIVLLQSEVMLWKDWNLAFEPRLGEAEFARVRDSIHRLGMRFIVYTSPYYFLRETPIASKAMNSFDHFETTGFPPGWPEGVNIDLFMNEITKVMTAYKPDGLYFDGQYTENVPALYSLARRSRALLGESGILEWHSTFALGSGQCFLPQADAYVDFILRGEGRDSAYANPEYLRYFVSCYNTSNSIGVLCNNGPQPSEELIDRVLAANGRMHTLVGWLNDPKITRMVHDRYRARLTPELRGQVERECEARQAKIAEHSKARAGELRALRAAPAWTAPLLQEQGQGFLSWTQHASPRNPNPFATAEGALSITACASAHAFLTREVSAVPKGFVARLKQGSDGGASWGPAVLIRWKNGACLRVGLRNDLLLQSDFNGEQRLFGKHDPNAWIWLRARWLETSGVVETSTDGEHFQPVWSFEHGGTLAGPAEMIAAGKVPYNGAALDYEEPGATGTCFIEQVRLY